MSVCLSVQQLTTTVFIPSSWNFVFETSLTLGGSNLKSFLIGQKKIASSFWRGKNEVSVNITKMPKVKKRKRIHSQRSQLAIQSRMQRQDPTSSTTWKTVDLLPFDPVPVHVKKIDLLPKRVKMNCRSTSNSIHFNPTCSTSVFMSM